MIYPVSKDIEVNFEVNKNGKVEKLIIIQGIDIVIDEEALRVVLQMLAWRPASKKGCQ